MCCFLELAGSLRIVDAVNMMSASARPKAHQAYYEAIAEFSSLLTCGLWCVAKIACVSPSSSARIDPHTLCLDTASSAPLRDIPLRRGDDAATPFCDNHTSIPSAQLGTTATSASVGLPLRGKPHHGDIRTHGLPSVLMPSFPPTQETFCHECVTDYVEKESKCPSCNQPTFANAPRPNTQMAAMVDHVRKLYELVPLTQRVKRKSH